MRRVQTLPRNALHAHTPITSEAASMQRSPAANSGTPEIPKPEDRGTDWDPPLHDTPPDEAVEPLTQQSPEQIQAPTGVGEPLELLQGEASRRAMGQMSPAPVHAREGKMPVGEAHGRPPDLANPQTQSSIAWEPGSVDPKAHVRAHQARRPVLDEGARMRPDPWPNLGVVNAWHVPTPCHSPASLGAPDEEEVDLRIIPPRGEHAAERPSRMLLERIRDTRVREDRRPSLDVDAQTHQTAEQDAQAASAALLEGEEKRTPSMSSEQAAAPGTPSTSDTHAAAAPLLEGEELWGTATSSEQAAVPATPSTSNLPSATPADPEATAQPRTRIHTRAHKPSCTAHDIQSGRVVHPGTSPPSSRAQSARHWGLHRRPRRSRGSDDSGRRCAGTLLKSLVAQHRLSRPETADVEALKPCTLAEAKRSPEPHELAT